VGFDPTTPLSSVEVEVSVLNIRGIHHAGMGPVADYLQLTKPPIILMLLVTALGGMMVAARGFPTPSSLILVLVGGGLAAGGASALNHYFDRDIDERMQRTKRRPVARGSIAPVRAFIFGISLNVFAVLILGIWVNVFSAILTLGASLFYVVVYTLWLKRLTTQNIVIGGAAGAMPPLVGWAGVTGGVELPAFFLFAIIFFWTPPHFWALSLLLRADYERAGVPMLPVVSGTLATARSIMVHSIILVSITMLFLVSQTVGWIYFLVAIALGTRFLLMAWRLLKAKGLEGARPLYLYSLLYLGLLFAAIMIDSLWNWPLL